MRRAATRFGESKCQAIGSKPRAQRWVPYEVPRVVLVVEVAVVLVAVVVVAVVSSVAVLAPVNAANHSRLIYQQVCLGVKKACGVSTYAALS